MSRAFLRQLAVAAIATLTASLAEGTCAALRDSAVPLTERGLRVVWAVGLLSLPSALFAAALAWLLARLCDEDSFAEAWRLSLARPALPIAIGALSLLTSSVYGLTLGSREFRNAELSATLVALATSGTVLVLGVVASSSLRRLRAGGSSRISWGLSLALLLATLSWLVAESWSGLVQLDVRLVAAPLGFALALLVADRYLLMRAGAGRVVSAVFGVWFVTGALFWGTGARAAPVLATHGAWSRSAVRAFQALTDFDRDGYSGLLGGGDCAPFDPKINPGSAEVADDGVDNNCVGGDSGRASEPRRPTWGASVHGSPTNQNVVIVTIETLRYDHASFVRAVNDTTPNLRRLAASSLVFERMYSAAPYTRLSLASLFSSFAPSEIDWQPLAPEKRARRISPRTPWLPELLAARGYETIAVLTSFSAFTTSEDIGFDRGFRHYDVSTELSYRGGTMWGFPAAAQVDKALGYVERAQRPFLLWLHLFEPHFRYEQPPGAPVFGADERARYDAEIWHVDAQLGRLFEGLRRLKAWDDTVLFVTGDHGESFGEHDDRWHGTNVFDPQVRPAALLRVPGVAGKRLDVSVTFTDVAPTLARVLGDRTTFDALRGRSLAPLMHHRTLPPGQDAFVVETFNIGDGRAYHAALVAHPLKLIYEEAGHRFSLYDLSQDPREQQPLDPRSDARAAPLLKELVGYLERARPRALEKR
ncbi:MAG: sulfatase [Polyangiaceae bacterium]|nr:sulfatase [Polyangiaceae bacterium]